MTATSTTKKTGRKTKFSSVNMLVPVSKLLRKSPVTWIGKVGERLTISDVVEASLKVADNNPDLMIDALREVRASREPRP